jgi:hypothetical protein
MAHAVHPNVRRKKNLNFLSDFIHSHFFLTFFDHSRFFLIVGTHFFFSTVTSTNLITSHKSTKDQYSRQMPINAMQLSPQLHS